MNIREIERAIRATYHLSCAAAAAEIERLNRELDRLGLDRGRIEYLHLAGVLSVLRREIALQGAPEPAEGGEC